MPIFLLAALAALGPSGDRSKPVVSAAAPPRAASVAAPEARLDRPRGRMAIGMNLAGIANYTTELPFIDYMKLTTDPAKGSLSIPVALGPIDLVMLYDGSTAVGAYDPKAGTANAIGYNAMGPTKYSPGRITFHSDAGGSVNFAIMHSDPANPMRNIRLMRAQDEAAYKRGAIFNPDFLDRVASHFSPLRMMDWGCTNGSGVTSWAQRPKPADATWPCVPLEIQIALANAAKADLWINIPHAADDDYILQAVTLIRDTLDPSLRLHLEYSNEVWNMGFPQNAYAQAQADKAFGQGRSIPWGHQMWAGYRAAQMASIARGVFGADADRRLAVLYTTFPHWGSSEADDAFDKGVARAGKGSVSTLFREYATTTYFGAEFGIPGGPVEDQKTVLGWVLGGPAGLDKAFQQLEHGGLLIGNGSLDFLAAAYLRDAARARAKGLDLVAYEGGLHISFFGTDHPAEFTDFINRMVADPRMGALYTRMVADFARAGASELTPFSDVGRIGIFGPWGMLPDLKSTTPRYEALRASSPR